MKQIKKDIIVLGAGFKGMMAAFKLAQMGLKVTLIEGSKSYGGVLNSPTWDEMYIDLGCHLFFNQTQEVTEDILNVIGDSFRPVAVSYASKFKGEKTEGIAVPNFEGLSEEEKRITYDILLKQSLPRKKVQSLSDYFINRFGDEAKVWIDQCLNKSHLINSEDLDPIANGLLPFKRIRLFPTEQAIELKKEEWYDERIAVERNANTLEIKQERHRNLFEFYPLYEGMHFFCEKLYQILLDRGVEVNLNTPIDSIDYSDSIKLVSDGKKIEADRLYWAAPQHTLTNFFNFDVDLTPYLHSIPIVLFYFTVNRNKVSSHTYVHNYDEKEYCFRISIQSNYADNNIPKETAVICCEVPTKIGSKIWDEPENFTEMIWQEAIDLGVVKSKNFEKSRVMKTPSAYKLPLKGYTEKFKELSDRLDHDKILGINSWEYSKNDILFNINEEIKKLK